MIYTMIKKIVMIGVSLLVIGRSAYGKIPIFTQNDPYPFFSTAYYADFYDEDLKYYAKGNGTAQGYEKPRYCLTALGYAQKATRGCAYDPAFYVFPTTQQVGFNPVQSGTGTSTAVYPNPENNEGWAFPLQVDDGSNYIPAGNIHGNWGALALGYGDVPIGQTLPPIIQAGIAQKYQDGQSLSYSSYTDLQHFLGFFSVPLKYQKSGFRFSFAFDLNNNFTFLLNMGIANVKQSAGSQSFINLSSNANNTGTSTTDSVGVFAPGYPESVYGTSTPAGIAITSMDPDVNTITNAFMVDPVELFTDIGLDISDVNVSGMEDTYCTLLWHQNIHVNEKIIKDEVWTPFIFTPFLKLTGIFATGRIKNEAKAFDLPLGSNGHNGIHVAVGMNFDFFETIEFCAAGGSTHFFQRSIAGRFVPNSEAQSAVYPFKTDVIEKPGTLYFFTLGINAFYFIERLSTNFEYVYINKPKDSISLIVEDDAFKPATLENTTPWKVQLLNWSLEYDLSPNMFVGALLQYPFAVRGAYKTGTIGANFSLQF